MCKKIKSLFMKTTEETLNIIFTLLNTNNYKENRKGYKKLYNIFIKKEYTHSQELVFDNYSYTLLVLYGICLEFGIGTSPKISKSIEIYKYSIKISKILEIKNIPFNRNYLYISLLRMALIRREGINLQRKNLSESIFYEKMIREELKDFDFILNDLSNNLKIKFLIGEIYFYGIKVERNYFYAKNLFFGALKILYKKAFGLVALCLERIDVKKYIKLIENLNFLGLIFNDGLSNYQMAKKMTDTEFLKKKFLKKAYKLGHLKAYAEYGDLIEKEKENYNLAIKIYKEGIKRGCTVCFGKLAEKYEKGLCVSKSPYMALYYYYYSSKEQNIRNKNILYLLINNFGYKKKQGILFKYFFFLIKTLKPENLFVAAHILKSDRIRNVNINFDLQYKIKFLVLLYEISIHKNYDNSMVALSLYFRHEFIDLKSTVKAFELMKKAAQLSNLKAMYSLGLFYYEGYGTEASIEDAIFWYAKASLKDDPRSQCFLAFLILKDSNLENKREIAIKYLKRAAEKGYLRAFDNLGHLYEVGEILEKNAEEAFKNYSIASNSGEKLSHFNLGRCYHEGIGIPKDLTKAVLIYYKGFIEGDNRCAAKIREVLTVDIFIYYNILPANG